MYAIYRNIYHPYTPNVSTYTSTMDPMAIEKNLIDFWIFTPRTSREEAMGIHPGAVL